MGKKLKQIDIIKQQLDMYLSMPNVVKKQNNWSNEQFQQEIELLKDKIEKSKRGKSSKRKGSTYERKVAKIYKEALGVELVRTPLSGGFQKNIKATNIKGDLSCLNDSIDFRLHTECKDQKAIKIRDWFNQACDDCPEGHIPTVVTHLIQVIKEGKITSNSEDLIVLRVSDFLDIIDKSKVIVPKGVKKVVRKKRSKGNTYNIY